ncbi:MAG TPA: hypothetical protein VF916_05945 [Ktedonobacterales bacterium]
MPPWTALAGARVGGSASPRHLHLLFLPPYAPALQPAEHLWALLASDLTDTALANRHLAAIDDLEDAQAARCVALQRQRTRICATTLFSWWPQHIRKQQGPGRKWYHIPTAAVYHRRTHQRWRLPRPQ